MFFANRYAIVFWVGPILLLTAVVFSQSLDYYVSPAGDDGNPGTESEPFATITQARDVVRQQQPLNQPVNIYFRDGLYFMTEHVEFTPQDSGTAQYPITYKSYPGEQGVLSGGRQITGWQQSGSLWQVQIPEVASGAWYFHQLFINGSRRHRAKTPNEGYFRTAGPHPADPISGFRYQEGDILTWNNLDDANIVAFHSWTSSLHFIDQLDEQNNIVTLKPPNTLWEFGKWEYNQRYYVENIFEALDRPGEWYLDRLTGILTYYPLPGEELQSVDAIAPVVSVTLISLDGQYDQGLFVEHLRFEDLAFQHTDAYIHEQLMFPQSSLTRNGMVMSEGVRNTIFNNCEFAHGGEHAIWLLNGCQNNQIVHCHIHDLGGGGIYIGIRNNSWGSPCYVATNLDEATSNNLVDNCFIHDMGHVFIDSVGVLVSNTSDNTISHNEICDGYYTGVSVGWCWGYSPSSASGNIVEYNHIHHLGKYVLSDMAGIYTLGISPGTILQNNVIHDVFSYPYTSNASGIYTDEGSSQILIENNIVYDVLDAGFFHHHGGSNIVQNNVFAYSDRKGIHRVRDEDLISFEFQRNIVYIDNENLLTGRWDNDNYVIDSNLYYTESGQPLSFDGLSFDDWQLKGHDVNSIISDPLFNDPANRDFGLSALSPAYSLGFTDIDVSQIGLYGDTDWVEAPLNIVRPTPVQPAPPRAFIQDDFELTGVGKRPVGCGVFEGEITLARVTDEIAAGGLHSLKFSDGLDGASYFPHIYYDGLHYSSGQVVFSCDFYNSATTPSEFVMEFRDWSTDRYRAGPKLIFRTDSMLDANGTIIEYPLATWIQVVLTFQVDDPTMHYSLQLTPDGQTPQTHDLQWTNTEFLTATWFGFYSLSEVEAYAYLDNLDLHNNVEPLQTPTQLQVAPEPGPVVTLSWLDNSQSEDGYIIQRKPYAGQDQWYTLETLPPDSNAYTDTNQVCGYVTYTYRVGAFRN